MVNYIGLPRAMLVLLGSARNFWNNPPSRKDQLFAPAHGTVTRNVRFSIPHITRF
jgi:hypothetical protein